MNPKLQPPQKTDFTPAKCGKMEDAGRNITLQILGKTVAQYADNREMKVQQLGFTGAPNKYRPALVKVGQFPSFLSGLLIVCKCLRGRERE